MSYEQVVSNLKVKLHPPYQVNGVKWMLEREIDDQPFLDEDVSKGGVLADEVGLGKTLMSISMIVGNPKPRTLLILPKSLLKQWMEQIQKFTHLTKVTLISKTTKILSEDTGIYIISNSLLNSKNSIVGNTLIHHIHWDRVIIDEAHLLRNEKSKIHQSCCMISADIRWALTATPVMNRMADFVNIMKWFGVSKFLCQSEKESVSAKFMMRRTQQDVSAFNPMLKLPPCKVDVEYIPFDTMEEAELYTSVFWQERNKITNSTNKTVTDLLEHLLRIRQLCIHPQLYFEGMYKKTNRNHGSWNKATTKLSKLLTCIQSHQLGDKTLVFCQFRREMDIYQAALVERDYGVVRLDGGMAMEERAEAIDKFKRKPEISIFLIQINTGGQGINLQVANRIYIMSPSWNPAIEHQAIGRAYRTGQTRPVFVKKFVIASGDSNMPFIEENMMGLQNKKKHIIADVFQDDRIVNSGENITMDSNGNVSASDIKYLFNLKQMQNC